MSAKRVHAKEIETTIISQHEIAAVWFIVDCRCGWQSPLCSEPEKAQRLYDAHRKRKSSPLEPAT